MKVHSVDRDDVTRHLRIAVLGTYQDLHHRYNHAKDLAMEVAGKKLNVPEGELTLYGGRADSPIEAFSDAAKEDIKTANRIAAGHRGDGGFDYAKNKKAKEARAKAGMVAEAERLFLRSFLIGRKPI
jgi:hypothetical protein